MSKNKTSKLQKPTYLVLGALVIALVAILAIYFIMIALGLVQVSPNHIVISTASADKMYDGSELRADGWEHIDGELLAGHTISATVLGSQTEVGQSDNFVSVTIFDSEGADVTSTYEIEYQLGKLTVHGKRLIFHTDGAEKYYDGTPLTCETWVFDEENSEQLMEGHAFTAACSGQITNVGEADNTLMVNVTDTVTGENVTNYYEIVVNAGKLKVSAIRLVVSFGTTGSLGSTGGNIDTNTVVVSGNLLSGHRVQCSPIDTEISGVNVSTVFVTVVDQNGTDVTEYYEIIYPVNEATIENPETYLPKKPQDIPLVDDYKNMENSLDPSQKSESIEDIKKQLEEEVKQKVENGEIPPEYAAMAMTPVYTIVADTDGYIYLRQQSYGDFDGNDWSDPPVYSGVSPYLYTYSGLKASNLPTATVKIRPLFNNLKYVLPYYYESGSYAPQQWNDCDTEGLPVTDEFYDAVYIPYEYSSEDGYQTVENIEDYQSFVYANYLNVNEDTKNKLLEIAAENGLDSTDSQIIEKVAEYIRGAATYNLEFAPFPDDVDSVIYFLTEGKEGVCRHFAAAATLMYRSLGIPARYVTGFAVDATAGEETVITAMMSHAWVEVYIDGLGWVQMEVTGGSIIGPGSGTGNSGGDNGNGDTGGDVSGDMESVNNGTNDPIFSVTSMNKTGTIYIRRKSFGDFNGKSWVDMTNKIDYISPYTLTLQAIQQESEYKLLITMLGKNMPYMLPYFTVEFDSDAGTTGSSSDVSVEGQFSAGQTYAVTYTYYDYIKLKGKGLSTDGGYDGGYYDFASANYLNVSETTKAGLESIIKDQIFKKEWEEIDNLDIYDKVKAVKDYLQNTDIFTYDEKNFPKAPEGEDTVLYFLTQSKTGKCSHFATAGTLIYRTLGIPARYTVGYSAKVSQKGLATGVSAKDAHAWVEVYIEGAGWVYVEVTAPKKVKPEDMTFNITIPTPDAKALCLPGQDEYLTSGEAKIDWSKFSQSGWTRQGTGEGERPYWICSNEYQEGHYFYEDEAEITGEVSRAEVTSDKGVSNTAKIKVYCNDENGDPQDVTSRYKVGATGKLYVVGIPITVKSGDGVGYCEELEVINGELPKGYTVKATYRYTQSNPFNKNGSTDNMFSNVIITDTNGNDVSRFYSVTYKYGVLTNA